MKMPVHPLLSLVENNKNGLKLLLKNYIDTTVDSQFDQLKNNIQKMIENGQFGPQSNNDSALACTQTIFQTDQSNNENSSSYLYHSNDQLTNTHNQITLPPCSSPVSTITSSPMIKQECLNDCNDGPNDEDKEQSNNVDIEVNHAQNGQVPIDEVKEEYNDDDDDDEGEYMSDCAECEDCVKGICGLVGEHDDAHYDAHTGVHMQIGLDQDQQNDLLESDPNVKIILDQQSIQPSTSGLGSSEDQSNGEANISDKRKKPNESQRKAVNKVRQNNNVGQIDQEGDDHDREIRKETKLNQVETLELYCTEHGCNDSILKSFAAWKNHLRMAHQKEAFKQLEDNVRHNQHGQSEYPCTDCDAVYMLRSSLTQHWKEFHQLGKFLCSVCAFVANLICDVRRHHQKYHFGKKFLCTLDGCNKAFKGKRDLEQHERFHSGKRPFKCGWQNCELIFRVHYNAICHVRKKHFRLPPTVREQHELNIIDERDPNLFVQVMFDD